MNLPRTILSGFWKEGHVQGIAVDLEKQHIYFSFTTILLKTDFEGTPLGSVRNLAGHLGCITFDADRRRVYGSLELKHDSIGKGIIDRTGWNPSEEDNFYLVCFDADKIDRMELDAEKDGIMRAVWLKQVVEEYAAIDPVSDKKHHYGCSGIDGTAYGPVFGTEGAKKIMVAYGIYSETARTDNDHNVILQYDHAGMVMARTRNGSLQISIDDHGLLAEADLSLTQDSRRLFEAIDTGLIDQMSFCFVIDDGGETYDKATRGSRRLYTPFFTAKSIYLSPVFKCTTRLRAISSSA